MIFSSCHPVKAVFKKQNQTKQKKTKQKQNKIKQKQKQKKRKQDKTKQDRTTTVSSLVKVTWTERKQTELCFTAVHWENVSKFRCGTTSTFIVV